MPIASARTSAFDILLRVETTDAYASELLHSSRTEKLSPADHGLTTEIVMGVLRWRSVLDDEIAAHVIRRSSAAKAADNSGTPPARLEAGPSRKDPSSGKDPLSKLDVEVITALRMGTYQLLFLDRIPAHAAINESVELVKKARKRSAAGMVNAVLRRVGKQALANNLVATRDSEALRREGIASAMPKKSLDAAPLGAEPADKAAINVRGYSARLEAVPSRAEPDVDSLNEETSPFKSRSTFDSLIAPGHSGQALASGNRFASGSAARDDKAVRAHPVWLVERWEHIYGVEFTESICRHDQTTANTVIRAEKSLIEELTREDIQLDPGKLLKNAYIVRRGDLTRTRTFRERRLVIQDEGSQLIALLLGHGEHIVDCCAAPGGKARILAERNPQATVIATELHAHRAALMARLVPLANVRVICADARNLPFAAQFDRILVDAPCTGTGTLARNPEIKWRLHPEDISRLHSYQIEILTAATQKLAPGGQLLYSTCSLEPEENEIVVERVLQASSGFRLLDIRDRLGELRTQGALLCDPDSLIRGSYLRTIPGVHPCDGFFAALLEREM